MIKGINTASQYITVQGGQPSSTYVNNYSGGQGVGNMRYNTSTQNVEVYDGSTWIQLSMSYATVDLSYDAQQLLEWARKEQRRQMERESRIKENPALQKAYEAIQRAEENFELIYKFVEHDNDAGYVQASP
jgi:hypothetical protein